MLTKVLEWGRLMAYLEQSTRYIPYNQRLNTGQYRYYRPAEVLESPLGARYVGDMDRVFDTYARSLAAAAGLGREAVPAAAGDSDFVYRQSTRAKALDALRGLLPAASLSNVGVYGTGQSYELLLLRMRAHPLPEARRTPTADARGAAQGHPVVPPARRHPRARGSVDRVPGDTAARDRRGRGPPVARRPGRRRPSQAGGGRVTLVDCDPDGEDKVIAAMCYPPDVAAGHEAARRVRALGHEDRRAIMRAYVGDRPNRRHRPGRAFERTGYRFDVVSDYGAFRDLQRHRMLTIEWQDLGPGLGYEMPDTVAEAGLGERYARSMARGRSSTSVMAPVCPRAGALRRGPRLPHPLRHADERPRGDAHDGAALGRAGPPGVPRGGPGRCTGSSPSTPGTGSSPRP